MKTKKPTRVNKSKEELIAQTKHLERVNRDKSLVKLMFPIVESQKTIYDAQTVLNALSGFIKAKIDENISEIVIKDLLIDLSKEEDSEVKTAIIGLIDMLQIEKARDTADLLERFARTLAQFSANEFMKKPMSEISVKNIIAE